MLMAYVCPVEGVGLVVVNWAGRWLGFVVFRHFHHSGTLLPALAASAQHGVNVIEQPELL